MSALSRVNYALAFLPDSLCWFLGRRGGLTALTTDAATGTALLALHTASATAAAADSAPQAGVAPRLPVWNALLGAYGRAGSVDAAYEAWVRMLDSGGAGQAGGGSYLQGGFFSGAALTGT